MSGVRFTASWAWLSPELRTMLLAPPEPAPPTPRRDPDELRRSVESLGVLLPVGADGDGVTVEARRRQRLPFGAFARGDLERRVVEVVERGDGGVPMPSAPSPAAWLTAPPAASWGRPLAEEAYRAAVCGRPALSPRDLAEIMGADVPRRYVPPGRRR